MSAQGGFMEFFEKKIMPKVYGFGAAIVIAGALFKLMHWPGASYMLIAGMGTEVVVFAMSAFIKPPKEFDWSKVYPQLAEDEEEEYEYEEEETAAGPSESPSRKLDEMMTEANIDQDMINRLGEGLNNLSDSVSKMSELSNAAVATNEYADNVQKASKAIEELNQSYSQTVNAMNEMANASTDAKEYHNQVQAITKNLGALNAVYEMELQDANNHLKAMNKFYGNLSQAMENMSEASKDTEQFKSELSKLSSNLSNLNNVYGNMLSAMKGSNQ